MIDTLTLNGWLSWGGDQIETGVTEHRKMSKNDYTVRFSTRFSLNESLDKP